MNRVGERVWSDLKRFFGQRLYDQTQVRIDKDVGRQVQWPIMDKPSLAKGIFRVIHRVE